MREKWYMCTASTVHRTSWNPPTSDIVQIQRLGLLYLVFVAFQEIPLAHRALVTMRKVLVILASKRAYHHSEPLRGVLDC